MKAPSLDAVTVARWFGLAAAPCAVLAFALSAAWLSLDSSLGRERGLVLEVVTGEGPAGADRLGLAAPLLPTRWQRDLPRGFRSLRFSGFWQVDRAGTVELGLAADGAAELRIDGRQVVRRREDARALTIRSRIDLGSGLHAIELIYEKEAPPFFLNVVERVDGSGPRPLDPWTLYPSPPGEGQLRRARWHHALGAAAGWAWAGSFLLLGASVALRGRAVLPVARLWARRLAPAVPVLIVAYGALLRFEALVARQWEPEAPAWAEHLKDLGRAARPAGPAWEAKIPRYEGDPVS
ncbi:MAG TPA: hypothetical protein VMV21_18065, partial [Vicinamibacteria bacterium]|nr:hypothetical protein [Vicinamibacteria bacterium]